MSHWIDPKEQSEEGWREATRREELASEVAIEDIEPIEETLERALAVELPYQYSEQVRYSHTELELNENVYTSGRAVVRGGVTDRSQIKLMAQGYLWNDNMSRENGERFKIQLRRPGPPDALEPFDDYVVWYRYQPGLVQTHPGLEFDQTGDTETKRGQLGFEAVPTPLQHHLVKLELVRNPPFARYVLRERDRWKEYVSTFRWDPEAFD